MVLYKVLEKDLVDKVLEKTNIDLNDPILVLHGIGWHEGVIGIVASRIKDKYNVECEVYSVKSLTSKSLIDEATRYYPIEDPLLL